MKNEMHEPKVQQALYLLDWAKGKIDVAMQIAAKGQLEIGLEHWEGAKKEWQQKINLAAAFLWHKDLSRQEMEYLSSKWGITNAQWKIARIPFNREAEIEHAVFELLTSSKIRRPPNLDDEQWEEALRRLPGAQIQTVLKLLDEAGGNLQSARNIARVVVGYRIPEDKWEEAYQIWQQSHSVEGEE